MMLARSGGCRASERCARFGEVRSDALLWTSRHGLSLSVACSFSVRVHTVKGWYASLGRSCPPPISEGRGHCLLVPPGHEPTLAGAAPPPLPPRPAVRLCPPSAPIFLPPGRATGATSELAPGSLTMFASGAAATARNVHR